MKPSRHVIISFSLSLGVWLFLKSLPAAIVCFLTGVFMDIDHVIEYVLNLGWEDFSLRNCYRECDHSTMRKGLFRFRKLYLIFHAVEFAAVLLLLAAITSNLYVFAFTLGYFGHLVFDILGNQEFVRPHFYFLSWRARRSFRSAKVLSAGILQKNRHLENI